MREQQQKTRKEKTAHPERGNCPERTGNAGPLQSRGLTEMQMIEKAINTKPPKNKIRHLAPD
ncbi:MAG: hypothetical protein HYU86_08265 [Chloroflexi bacterium]|nr:hypothetical protein [Chloroflexota bacterium]